MTAGVCLPGLPPPPPPEPPKPWVCRNTAEDDGGLCCWAANAAAAGDASLVGASREEAGSRMGLNTYCDCEEAAEVHAVLGGLLTLPVRTK